MYKHEYFAANQLLSTLDDYIAIVTQNMIYEITNKTESYQLFLAKTNYVLKTL